MNNFSQTIECYVILKMNSVFFYVEEVHVDEQEVSGFLHTIHGPEIEFRLNQKFVRHISPIQANNVYLYPEF